MALLAADVPFILGFQEPQLNDCTSIEIMNVSYQWKAANVASRLNAGAAVGYEGLLGWIIKKIMGKEAVKKLMERPSYIATWLLHAKVLTTKGDMEDPLMEEWIELAEVVMEHHWNQIKNGQVYALTEEEWAKFLSEFLALKGHSVEETLCMQARNATASKTLITPTPNTTHTNPQSSWGILCNKSRLKQYN
ncbi:hypothetical protein EV421DRAFT_1996187 [Armillaria borealis]|uniref:Uncharacterized protein n=1 Tax=Armillaria borealis TaxID=47425 RepID=A0AA39JV33_9AGAR|nr:hypothetical protein EV421DRAFT_1996187 [Armillaria borealis]